MARKPKRSRKSPSRLAALKPRNPLVAAARQRAAGPHGPSHKAARTAGKVKLRKRPDEA